MPKKKRIGQVISDKMDKTIVVEVTRLQEHLLYHKKYQISKKFKVHDSENKGKVGDLVEIIEIRPFSKNKTWQINRIIKEGKKK